MGNFNMLPSEIMLEILTRLPAESVLECKLVSKPWSDLVQHPSFSKMHFNHLNDLGSTDDSGKLSFIFFTPAPGTNINRYPHIQQPFYYTEYDENLNRFSRTTRINLRLPFENYCVIGSCNGLICFNACFHSGTLNDEPAYICNPITREYIILPKSKSDRVDFVTGFGYCHSTNEYKVVRIYLSWPGLGKPDFIQVYTLGSGIGWRNREKISDVIFTKQCGAFANGAIHWADTKGSIASFDLADEELQKFLSPPNDLIEPVFVLGDFLCEYNCNSKDGYRGIWFLTKNENNQDVFWSKEFSDFRHYFITPITITKSGGFLYYDGREKNVYRYAPDAPSSRILVSFGENFQFGVLHKNTLLSLKALGEEDTKLMDSGQSASSSEETKSSDSEPKEKK